MITLADTCVDCGVKPVVSVVQTATVHGRKCAWRVCARCFLLLGKRVRE